MTRLRQLGVVLLLLLVIAVIAAPLPEAVELPPTGMDMLDRHGKLLYQAIDPRRGASPNRAGAATGHHRRRRRLVRIQPGH